MINLYGSFSYFDLERAGLNSTARQDAVRMLVNAAKVDIVCLQETKMADVSPQLILSMLRSDFDDNFIFLPSVGASGGVLIAWRATLGAAGASRVDEFCASVQFYLENGEPWWLTCVYGPQANEEKISFLQELTTLWAYNLGPWLLLGDFNMIYKDEDKNNSNLNCAMMVISEDLLMKWL
jgi:exonuclease III